MTYRTLRGAEQLPTSADGAASRASVAVVRCQGYDEAAVDDAVGRGLMLLGGVEQFVAAGEHLLLKPNLLTAARPEQAVTTHPAVFRAVAHHLLAASASLTYGDSPGFELRSGTAARAAGMAAVAEELGIPTADFSRGQDVSFPDGRLIKRFTLAAGVVEADGVVSLPKLKTHGLTRITGAIKNQFGCIPGILKSEFHARLSDLEHFSQMLVDLNRLVRPRLYVMDGIVAMEGNGPRNGKPRPLSVLLVSSDPVALDSVVCRLVGLDPELVRPIWWGEEWGLGRYRDVELLGDSVEDLAAEDFDVNRQRSLECHQGGVLSRAVRNWMVPRPVVVAENCTLCGACVEACPVTPKAIQFVGKGGHKQPPVHDYSACIRCFCCQEMCPQGAIVIETPLLGRIIHRRKGGI